MSAVSIAGSGGRRGVVNTGAPNRFRCLYNTTHHTGTFKSFLEAVQVVLPNRLHTSYSPAFLSP